MPTDDKKRWRFTIKDLLVATVVVAAGLAVLVVARGVAGPREIGDAKALQAGLIGGGSCMIGFGLAWVFRSRFGTPGYSLIGCALSIVILLVAMYWIIRLPLLQ